MRLSYVLPVFIRFGRPFRMSTEGRELENPEVPDGRAPLPCLGILKKEPRTDLESGSRLRSN